MGSNISLKGSARELLSFCLHITEIYLIRRTLSTSCSTKASRLARFLMPGREQHFEANEHSPASSFCERLTSFHHLSLQLNAGNFLKVHDYGPAVENQQSDGRVPQ